MLIELFEKKWPDIRKIGQDAVERGKTLGLKTDWQEERESQPAEEHSGPEKRAQKRRA